MIPTFNATWNMNSRVPKTQHKVDERVNELVKMLCYWENMLKKKSKVCSCTKIIQNLFVAKEYISCKTAHSYTTMANANNILNSWVSMCHAMKKLKSKGGGTGEWCVTQECQKKDGASIHSVDNLPWLCGAEKGGENL